MTTMPQPPPQTSTDEMRHLKQWRCWKCGALLARVWLQPGCAVEIKCKCNAMNMAALGSSTS
jgi:phage FluMu protein Com